MNTPSYTKENKDYVLELRGKGLRRNEIQIKFKKKFGLLITPKTISDFCRGTSFAIGNKESLFTPEMIEYLKANYTGRESLTPITKHLNTLCGDRLTNAKVSNKVTYLELNEKHPAKSFSQIAQLIDDAENKAAKILAIKEKVKLDCKVRVVRERWDGEKGTTEVTATVKGIYPHFINVVYKDRDILVSYAWDTILAVVKG